MVGRFWMRYRIAVALWTAWRSCEVHFEFGLRILRSFTRFATLRDALSHFLLPPTSSNDYTHSLRLAIAGGVFFPDAKGLLMRSRHLFLVACCLLFVLGASSSAPAQPFDPGLYDSLRWRMIGPFRGGRTVGATGVPGQPNVFYIGV